MIGARRWWVGEYCCGWRFWYLVHCEIPRSICIDDEIQCKRAFRQFSQESEAHQLFLLTHATTNLHSRQQAIHIPTIQLTRGHQNVDFAIVRLAEASRGCVLNSVLLSQW